MGSAVEPAVAWEVQGRLPHWTCGNSPSPAALLVGTALAACCWAQYTAVCTDREGEAEVAPAPW